jgi:hypothetical protein
MQIVDSSELTVTSSQVIPTKSELLHYSEYPQFQLINTKPTSRKFRRFLLTIHYKDGFEFEIFPPYAIGLGVSTLVFMAMFPSLAFFFVPIYATLLVGIAMEYIELNEMNSNEDE